MRKWFLFCFFHAFKTIPITRWWDRDSAFYLNMYDENSPQLCVHCRWKSNQLCHMLQPFLQTKSVNYLSKSKLAFCLQSALPPCLALCVSCKPSPDINGLADSPDTESIPMRTKLLYCMWEDNGSAFDCLSCLISNGHDSTVELATEDLLTYSVLHFDFPTSRGMFGDSQDWTCQLEKSTERFKSQSEWVSGGWQCLYFLMNNRTCGISRCVCSIIGSSEPLDWYRRLLSLDYL